MIKGLSFQVPNEISAVIYYILKGIEIRKYFWFVAQEDVIDDFFKKDRYHGEEFEEVINDESCYAVFLNLQAYHSEEDVTEINTYEDYLKSKCEFVLFIDDKIYISFYAKGRAIIEKIKEQAEYNGFKNIKYITDENDNIRMFRVLNCPNPTATCPLNGEFAASPQHLIPLGAQADTAPQSSACTLAPFSSAYPHGGAAALVPCFHIPVRVRHLLHIKAPANHGFESPLLNQVS